MNETNEYILNTIKNGVWSGFYTPEDVNRLIDDVLEEDADDAVLRAAVLPEFDKKASAERSWPDTTECDRLDDAFTELECRTVSLRCITLALRCPTALRTCRRGCTCAVVTLRTDIAFIIGKTSNVRLQPEG